VYARVKNNAAVHTRRVEVFFIGTI